MLPPRSTTQAASPGQADAAEALLRAAKAGDRDALASLVCRFQNAVVAQLRGILAPAGRDAWIEDLAQETFLRAFGAIDRFEGSASRMRPWLVTIATRLALNELRRKRASDRPVDTVLDLEPARAGRPDTDAQLVGQGVQRALASLPATFRAAFLLRELHGLDYAEVARILEVDLGTVKSRLSRARARLRAALESEGEPRR